MAITVRDNLILFLAKFSPNYLNPKPPLNFIVCLEVPEQFCVDEMGFVGWVLVGNQLGSQTTTTFFQLDCDKYKWFV